MESIALTWDILPLRVKSFFQASGLKE